MKKTSLNSVGRILTALIAVVGLSCGHDASAQSCALSIPANNTAAVTMEASPAWWNHFDYSQADNLSFFYTTVVNDTAGVLPGFYEGWCIDTADDISSTLTSYTATFYSTCDPAIDTELPAAYPANIRVSLPTWHQINYLLNHKNGAYWFDIQVAIWNLMGQTIPAYQLEGNSQGYPNINTGEVNQLIADATANAANWQPQCGDVIAVVVAINASPVDQLTIIEVPYPCIESVDIRGFSWLTQEQSRKKSKKKEELLG